MLGWFAEQPAEVQVAVIGMIGAVAVALIQFWKGKPTDRGGKAAEIAGALVDNSAINQLAEAVDDLVSEVKSTKNATSRMTDQLDHRLESLSAAIDRLREEMIKRVGR